MANVDACQEMFLCARESKARDCMKHKKETLPSGTCWTLMHLCKLGEKLSLRLVFGRISSKEWIFYLKIIWITHERVIAIIFIFHSCKVHLSASTNEIIQRIIWDFFFLITQHKKKNFLFSHHISSLCQCHFLWLLFYYAPIICTGKAKH